MRFKKVIPQKTVGLGNEENWVNAIRPFDTLVVNVLTASRNAERIAKDFDSGSARVNLKGMIEMKTVGIGVTMSGIQRHP